MPKSITRGRRKRKYRKRKAQPYYKRGTRKSSKAKKKIKRAVKRKRGALTPAFTKKLKRVAKRVLTSMDDDKAVMYRQYVAPDSSITDAGGVTHFLDNVTPITDGAWVANTDPVMKAILRREHNGFFQIEAFRGMVAPSWGKGILGAGDDNLHQDIGQTHPHNWAGTVNDRIDIRAFKQVEIPLLPCIPKVPLQLASIYKPKTELDKFARSGNKIKITNNYMRFRFFATKNGHIENFNLDTHHMENPTTTFTGGKKMMCGFNNNIKVTRTAGTGLAYETETHTPYNPANVGPLLPPVTIGGATQVDVTRKQIANQPISYEITAKRFAKVRIIVWERECFKNQQVQLSDFMKYSDTTKWEDEFHYGSEELHLNKRFYSKKKTKRDMPYFMDTQVLQELAKGKFLVDKIINLPMGREKTVILNPLKGKVLEYDPVEPKFAVTDTGAVTENQVTGDHDEATGIPLSTNHIPLTDSDLGKRIEYVPLNKQYGMFMLFNVQRAGVEYDIFQKFEYDK